MVTKHFRANVQLLSSAAHCPASHSLFQGLFVSFYLCQVFQLTEDCSKFMCFFVTFDIGSLCPLQPTVMIVESPHRATYFCKVVDILDYKRIYRLVYQRMHRLVYSRIYRLYQAAAAAPSDFIAACSTSLIPPDYCSKHTISFDKFKDFKEMRVCP